jgi:hypothetical protein
MKQTPYTGSSSNMKESPWLASEDILDKEGGVPVTVEAVTKTEGAKFEGGREEKKPVYSLKFKGKEKEMILNGVNRRAMVEMFGTATKNWVDQEITIYVQSGIKLMGELVNGLRIKTPDITLADIKAVNPFQKK